MPVKDVDLFCAPAAVSEVVLNCGTHPYSSEQANRTMTEAFVTFRAEKVWTLDSVHGNAGNEGSERVDFLSNRDKVTLLGNVVQLVWSCFLARLEWEEEHAQVCD